MRCKKVFFCLALSCFGAVVALRAQSNLITLHNFSALNRNTNNDGANPVGTLILSAGKLYGTTIIGGPATNGTLFAVNVNDGGISNLHNFTGANDGSRPYGGLTLSGTILYGTAQQGGSAQNGNVFLVNTDGTGFNVLYSFSPSIFNSSTFISTNSDGSGPVCTLAISGNMIYGTANGAGAFGHGTIFAISVATNGNTFTNLYTFSGVSGTGGTNKDGSGPYGALVLSGGMLYGTTYQGGTAGAGSIFRINTNGTGFTNLHNFTASPSDGGTAESGLTLAGNTLFGTTAFGGASGNGAIFAINTDGSGYTNLHFFSSFVNGTNFDGYQPRCTIAVSGGTLYGTASGGGTAGDGTVYSIGTNGGGFATLYNLTNATTGANPYAGITLSGNVIYGATSEGGTGDDGTVFSLTVKSQSPLVKITPIFSSAQTVISWPETATNFVLQTSTNLLSRNWSNITTGVFTSGSNFVYTNPINGSPSFFRLQGR